MTSAAAAHPLPPLVWTEDDDRAVTYTRALAMDPANRFPSMAAFGDALDAVLRSTPPGAGSPE